jgi:hypothetical protein
LKKKKKELRTALFKLIFFIIKSQKKIQTFFVPSSLSDKQKKKKKRTQCGAWHLSFVFNIFEKCLDFMVNYSAIFSISLRSCHSSMLCSILIRPVRRPSVSRLIVNLALFCFGLCVRGPDVPCTSPACL